MTNQPAHDLSGYLLLNKQSGITSFGALNAVKKALGTGKVGHTGTLDKFATGLLLVLVGRAVKLANYFSGSDKRYEAVIKFGAETDTLDPEGAIVSEGPLPSPDALLAALPRFCGDILQEPPVYSAIHIDGERASALARSGEQVAMKKRPVSIYSLDLLAYEQGYAKIRVHCSKGTYIRSLARDLANAAGSCGHLISLNREQIAGFRLAEACPADAPNLAEAIHPITEAAFDSLGLPCLTVSDETATGMAHGKKLEALLGNGEWEAGSWGSGGAYEAEGGDCKPRAGTGAVGVFRQDGGFVGVIERQNGIWRYGYVYSVETHNG
jgi:tRNA pseudouridine55 synthase